MANIPEPTPEWGGVYQLEKVDQAIGGTGGIMNRQAIALMSRVGYVRQVAENAQSAAVLASETAAGAAQAADLAAEDGAARVGFLGSDVSVALDSQKLLPIEVLAAKYGLSLVDDAAPVINAAWSDGYGVLLGPRSYPIASTAWFVTGATIVGFSERHSQLQVAAGFTGNLFDTESWDVSAVANVMMRSMGIVGPLDTVSVSAVDALPGNEGVGVRLFGNNFILRDLRIERTAGIGLHTKLPLELGGGGKIDNVRIFRSGQENFLFEGPNDVVIHDVTGGWPWNSFADTDNSKVKDSKVYPGVIGAVGGWFRSACETGIMHFHNNRFGYAFALRSYGAGNTARFTFDHLIGESSKGGAYFYAADSAVGAVLDCHTQRYGLTSLPFVDIATSARFILGTINVLMDGTNNNGSTALRISGDRCIINGGRVFAFTPSAGHGVEIGGSNHRLNLMVNGRQGTAADAGPSAGVRINYPCTNLTLDATVTDCDRAISFASAATDPGVIKLYASGCTLFLHNPSFLIEKFWGRAQMVDATNSVETSNIVSTTSLMADGTWRSVSMAHGLAFTPTAGMVNLELSAPGTGDIGDFQLVVSTINATNVLVRYKINTSTATPLRLIARINC